MLISKSWIKLLLVYVCVVLVDHSAYAGGTVVSEFLPTRWGLLEDTWTLDDESENTGSTIRLYKDSNTALSAKFIFSPSEQFMNYSYCRSFLAVQYSIEEEALHFLDREAYLFAYMPKGEACPVNIFEAGSDNLFLVSDPLEDGIMGDFLHNYRAVFTDYLSQEQIESSCSEPIKLIRIESIRLEHLNKQVLRLIYRETNSISGYADFSLNDKLWKLESCRGGLWD